MVTFNDAEEFVRQHYPDAYLERQEPIYEIGKKAPYQLEEWVVYPRPARGLGDKPLGIGSTAEDAWKDAADKISGD